MLNAPAALEKRIKRHVIGRLREYFAVTAPGFEFLCLQELQSLPLTLHRARACPGGVIFEGRLVDCFIANLHLRTANRVLMRIGAFKATGFHELQTKCSNLPWELFLEPDQPIELRIRSKKSRLYHTRAIADRFRGGFAERMSSHRQTQQGPGQSPQPQKIFIRVVKDRFTVSLDSSGANLHKRGIKTKGSKAPLRETTAAAILMLADYMPPEPLLDPMCGSGTFSVEAAMLASNIPAGFFRDFAFTAWPAHRQAKLRWEHLTAEAEKRISVPKEPLVLASDIDRRACNAFEAVIGGHRFAAAIDISPCDFFELDPQPFARRPGLVVINPPYGRRIDSPTGARELLGRIGDKLLRHFAGWKFALIVPSQSMLRQIPFPAAVFPFFHGGLQVVAAVGKVPPASDFSRP